ncbi:MAG: NTP transferase domain-containing protein [Planctomycetota bacterium]
MRAVILAAGQGTRLRPLTDDRPKALVDLCGMSLIERQVRALQRCGIERIFTVGGYRADQLAERGYLTHENRRFADTNMVATLFACARDLFAGVDDLIVSYGDIVCEPRIIHTLMQSQAEIAVAVDVGWRSYWELRHREPLSDAETLKFDGAGCLRELGKKPNGYGDIEAQYMGLFKVRADRLAPLLACYDSLDHDARYDGQTFDGMYMTSFLQHLIDHGWRLEGVRVEHGWLEVDSTADLALYQRLQSQGQLRDLCALES